VGQLKELKIPERSPRRVGIVESDARDKTRKVAIHYSVRHPKYGKYIRRRTVLQVHDEDNVSKVGDQVEVAECRPISKTKSWVLLRVVEAAHAPVTTPVAAEESTPDE
jgi:small subunit ribosomal protein S17